MGFDNHLPTRRELLVGSGALFAWSQMPRIARAEGRDPRLLVIVLRGALDGLGAEGRFGRKVWGLLSLELWQQAYHDRAATFRKRAEALT